MDIKATIMDALREMGLTREGLKPAETPPTAKEEAPAPPPTAPIPPAAQLNAAEAFFAREMAGALSSAKEAATKRYGAGSADLPGALATLDALHAAGSIDALRDMAKVHTEAAPAVLAPASGTGAGRTTTGTPAPAAPQDLQPLRAGGSWDDYRKQSGMSAGKGN
jgi:hypothetical protein